MWTFAETTKVSVVGLLTNTNTNSMILLSYYVICFVVVSLHVLFGQISYITFD